MRPDTEEKILAACNQAKAGGWKFTALNEGDARTCGCALQAVAYIGGHGADWGSAGDNLGLESPKLYGAGFDLASHGRSVRTYVSDELRMGYRHGRHFVHGDPL